MRKKYLPVLLTAALLFCGCGGDTASPGPYPAPEASETQAAPEVTETSVSAVSGTVTAAAETERTASGRSTGAYDLPGDFYDKLYAVIDRYPHFRYYDISIAYRDIETGFTVMLNPDVHYYSASVIKAPYALYLYRLALAGKADLEQIITYTEAFRREGTGVLKDTGPGGEYTVEELIGYALEESDNSAFAMLKSLYPEDGYEKFAASLGVHDVDARGKGGPQICCGSALIFSQAVYDFIEEGNPYSEDLRYHMTHSRNTMVYGGEGAEVVRKYGWYEGYFHDMAVVYGEKNYLLTIMTDFDLLEIGADEYGLFRELSLLFAEYCGKVSAAPDSGDTVIIKIPKPEDDEMILPSDPYMLLSVINMKLRDSGENLDDLCGDLNADKDTLSADLEKIGYAYDKDINQFVPVPEETSETSAPEGKQE